MIKKIIKQVGPILIILCVFGMSWALLRYLLVDDTTAYTRLTMHEYYEQDQVDVLFMGASHCYRGFNPEVADDLTGLNTFNLGSASQPIEVTYLLMQDAVKRYDVKHIYVDLSYNIAKKKGLNMNSVYLITDYMKPSFAKTAFLMKYSDDDTYVNSFLLARRNSQEFFDIGHISDVFSKKRSREYREFSYIANGGGWYGGKGYVGNNEEIQDGTFMDSYKGEAFSLAIPEKWNVTIKNMMELCEKNNVELTFISTPISAYRLLAYGDYDAYIDYVTDITDEYGIEYIDFNLLREEYWEDTSRCFMDYSHLNEEGSKRFTRILMQYMQGGYTKEELLYSSIKEKYDVLPPKFYGVLHESVSNDEGEILNSIVTNDNGKLYYRVLTEADGKKEVLRDWSQDICFYVPAQYEGNCYIDVCTDPMRAQSNIESYCLNIKN